MIKEGSDVIDMHTFDGSVRLFPGAKLETYCICTHILYPHSESLGYHEPYTNLKGSGSPYRIFLSLTTSTTQY